MGSNFNPWWGAHAGAQAIAEGIDDLASSRRQAKKDVQATEQHNIWAEGQKTENEKSKIGLQSLKDFTAHMAAAAPGEDLEVRAYQFLRKKDPERADKLQASFIGNAAHMVSLGDPEKAVEYYNAKTGAGLKYAGSKGDYLELETGDGQKHLFNWKTQKMQSFGDKKDVVVPEGAAVKQPDGTWKVPAPREPKSITNEVDLFTKDPKKAAAFMDQKARIQNKYRVKDETAAEFMTNLYLKDPKTFNAVFNRSTADKETDRKIALLKLATNDLGELDMERLAQLEAIIKKGDGKGQTADGRRQTATGPNGEKIEWDGTKWVPVTQ